MIVHTLDSMKSHAPAYRLCNDNRLGVVRLHHCIVTLLQKSSAVVKFRLFTQPLTHVKSKPRNCGANLYL